MDLEDFLTLVVVMALIITVPVAVILAGYYSYYGVLPDAEFIKRGLAGWGATVTAFILLTGYDGI